MGLGGKIKNMLRDWLDIQEAQGNSVTIQEVNTFISNCFRNQLWYKGDSSELHQYYIQTDDLIGNARFWSAVSSNGMNFRKIHTGLPGLIIDTIADIVIDTFNSVKIENNKDKQKVWEEIQEENDFKELIKDAIIDTLTEGDGAFKISYDTVLSKYPILEFYPASKVDYIFKRGRITDIIFKTEYASKLKKYVLEEVYNNDGVKHILYENGDHSKSVGLDTLEETKGLSDVTENGFIMAIPLRFNKSKMYKGRGQSILDKKIDNFDSYDEVWSQWIEAIRDNRTKTYIPESLIPRDNEGNLLKPNAFDNRFVKIENGNSENNADKVETKQGEIQHEALLSSYITALDLCLQGIISPSTLGIDVKKLDNSEAQREKEKTTLYTRNKIVRVLEKVLPKVAESCLKAYDKANEQPAGEYEVVTDFGEYANPSFEAQVETVAKARPGQSIMSIERIVEELYGDSLTDDEKEKEVNRLKEEQGITQKEEPSVY